MDKRIALQFFGQLRYVEVQNSIEPFINFLIDKGFIVDLYATFWDDEYTREKVRQGKFDNFESINLITEPDLPSGTLDKYFYSLENTLQQRNKKYDFIIFSRYDNYFNIDNLNSLNKFYQEVLDQSTTPSIFFVPNAYKGSKIDDKLFICNEQAANKICVTYSKYKNKEFNIPYLKYHSSLLDAINFLDIKLFLNIKFFSYNLIRHTYLAEIDLDQSIKYGRGLLRDYIKKFQDFNKMKNFLKKVTS